MTNIGLSSCAPVFHGVCQRVPRAGRARQGAALQRLAAVRERSERPQCQWRERPAIDRCLSRDSGRRHTIANLPRAPSGWVRRGALDCALALLLGGAALSLSRLEDATNRHKWVALGLGFAAPLLLAGLLQLRPARPALFAAAALHGALLAFYVLLLLLCVPMAVSILLLPAAVVLAAPTLLLGLNSALALWRLVDALRARSAG